jgi:hypothetical protein
MSDEQDQAEAIDPDELGDDPAANFPPDKPPGAQAYGAAGAEPHADEPVASRAAREEPEAFEVDQQDADDIVDTASDEDPDARPAEEAAMHILDEGLADFDSEVDDPALEAAWETDPEVDR